MNKLKHIIVSPKLIKRFSHSSTIRNVGILAHIDAGKTTTTERMLFYAGKTKSLGEVHHGNTITDYLSQERERGITICSSAVSFPWKGHKINLLDTPGHIDFTMEVEQSLSAVDGSVIILDGSAGVEAQTITVWTQTSNYNHPRIVFVNKMDRTDADFEGCLNDLQRKLDACPLPLQWPVLNSDGRLEGIIDIVNMKQLQWDPNNSGRSYKVSALSGELLSLATQKRTHLVDTLSGLDDNLAEVIITNNSMENVDEQLILDATRRATIARKIVPVLLGSAYKNVGVQPLIDSITKFLPAPHERNQLYDCFGENFAGKVFKVVHDKQRGPLSLVRVVSGKLKRGAKITTINGISEAVQRMYAPLADEYLDIDSCESGDVCVCAGLKNTVTGDLLVNNMSSIRSAQKRLTKFDKSPSKDVNGNEDDDSVRIISEKLGLKPFIPDAVYFCSVEPPSLSQQLALENALKQLQREDPSLRVNYNEATMQTVLGGMGELHLDIVKSRILSEYKIEVDLGPLQIAYKETLNEDSARDRLTIEKIIAGNKQHVSIELSLVKNHKEMFQLDNNPEAANNLSLIRTRYIHVVKKGAVAALDRGPKIGGKVVDVQLVLHSLTIGRGTAEPFIIAAAGQCVQKILMSSGCRLLEPIMLLQIVTPSDRLSQIIADLSRRRSTILDISAKGELNKIIEVIAPLAELSGYSSALRTISSGGANMSMQPHGYAAMGSSDEATAIRKAQGLE